MRMGGLSGAVGRVADAGVEPGGRTCADHRRPRGAPAAPGLDGLTSIRAVIFDLDGVLVDSEIWWDEVRIAFAENHGRPWTSDDRAAVMGANSRGWSAIMRERLAIDMPEPEIERAVVDGVIERYRHEGAPRIEGAVETVRRIATALPVAVASSAHPAVIAAALEATGLAGIFAAVVSSDAVAHGKPSPDVYLETARRLGFDPAACLVVEDSRNGVLAAKAAGMTVVLVPNTSVPPAPGTAEVADLVLDRLSDLDLALVEAAHRTDGAMADGEGSGGPA
jgi:HAD superfamily hydrolase (TIGR01509 family)